ncbi:MAG: acetyl-CoA acetyltransferase [Clostridia bacterium]|nr:MAG: acetyl-CoA acetyltransferase [Clostridia bacterium]
MRGIKDQVAIIGMGCSKFGERWDAGVDDLIIEAVYEAYADANIEPKDIQAAWLGTVFSGFTAISLTRPLQLSYIPVTQVENLCATGAEALRAAAYAVAAGACDMALAVGVEKLKDTGWTGLPAAPLGGSQIGSAGEIPVPAPPGFASLANRYFHHYGIDPREGKKTIAQIAVKNHRNGNLAPKAHFHREITLEEALNAPVVCWPLGLYDCCGVSDGAAVAILVPASKAKDYRRDPIYLKAAAISVGSRQGLITSDYDYVHFEENVRAARMAYQEAGIIVPLEELSIAEVHDCFTITEMVIYEDLGWCPRGQAKSYIEDGVFTREGKLPVNTDGGLKCFGHPLGASGLRMMYEVYQQLQGKAGARQVQNPRLGLTHNLGGSPGMAISSVQVAGNELG